MENNIEQLEEKVEVKKKGNKGLVILVILLLLICCGLGAFIFMNKDKIFAEQEQEKEKEVKEEKIDREDVNINSSLVINLFNIFRLDKACYMNVKDINNTNYVRLRIAYDNLTVPEDVVACSKVGASYKGSYCGSDSFSGDTELSNAYVKEDKSEFNKIVEERISTRAVNPKYLKAKYEELFGTDANYKDEDFGLGHLAEPTCYIMHYDEKNNIYAQYACEGGGTCGGSEQTISKAYKENDKLYIETNYKDPDDASDEGRKTSKGTTKIIYIFKTDKTNGNYVLEKVEEK